jgi:hypothetical protein
MGMSAIKFTVLQALHGKRLTKAITPNSLLPYEDALKYDAIGVTATGIEEVYELLNGLRGDPSTALVMGRVDGVDDGDMARNVYRRLKAHHPDGTGVFVDQPSHLLVLDIDGGLDFPEGWCNERILAEGFLWVRDQLPPPYATTACVAQFSSGLFAPGRENAREVRCRFYFEADTPLRWEDRRALYSALCDEASLTIDVAVARPVQLIYIANPVVLDAGVDPVPPERRMAFLPGEQPIVRIDLEKLKAAVEVDRAVSDAVRSHQGSKGEEVLARDLLCQPATYPVLTQIAGRAAERLYRNTDASPEQIFQEVKRVVSTHCPAYSESTHEHHKKLLGYFGEPGGVANSKVMAMSRDFAGREARKVVRDPTVLLYEGEKPANVPAEFKPHPWRKYHFRDSVRRVIAVPAHDKDWRDKTRNLARALRHKPIIVDRIRYDESYPAGWTLADELPKVGGHFKADPYRDVEFCTWMTDLVPAAGGRGGRPSLRLRELVKGRLTYVRALDAYVFDSRRHFYRGSELDRELGHLADGSISTALERADIAKVDRPGYLPEQAGRRLTRIDDRSVVNLYEAPSRRAVKPSLDEYRLMKAFLQYFIPSRSDRLHFIRWVKTVVVHPERRVAVGVLLRSALGGVGKNTVAEVIRQLVGPRNTSIPSEAEMKSQFNGYAAWARFIIGNEIDAEKGAYALTEKLKSAISEATISVNEKFLRPYEVDNRAYYLLLSNHMTPLVLTQESDRRWLIPGVAESKYGGSSAKHKEFFQKVYAFLNHHDGYAKIRWVLEELTVAFEEGEDAPLTHSKKSLVRSNRAEDVQAILDLFELLTPAAQSAKDGYVALEDACFSAKAVKAAWEDVFKHLDGAKAKWKHVTDELGKAGWAVTSNDERLRFDGDMTAYFYYANTGPCVDSEALKVRMKKFTAIPSNHPEMSKPVVRK